MIHIDIAIGIRAKPRLMIIFVSGIVKLSSKLLTRARTLMTVAMVVPIAAPLIAPSTPSPSWMNQAIRTRLKRGREASTRMNVIGRRSNQMMMSQSLKIAATPPRMPAQSTSSDLSALPMTLSAIGTRKMMQRLPPIRPSREAQRIPLPRLFCGLSDTVSSLSSPSLPPPKSLSEPPSSSSACPKVRRSVPGLLKMWKTWVIRPEMKSSSV